jgi:hypothetical protein
MRMPTNRPSRRLSAHGRVDLTPPSGVGPIASIPKVQAAKQQHSWRGPRLTVSSVACARHIRNPTADWRQRRTGAEAVVRNRAGLEVADIVRRVMHSFE